MERKYKIALVVSAVFLVVAVLYGQLSTSSSEPGISFTAEGEVVSRVFQPEHAASPTPLTRQQLGHAEVVAKVGARYLIKLRLDSGEMLTGDCEPHAIDMYPVGQRVTIQAERTAGMFFGKRTIIHSMLPKTSPAAK
jgi:hypothetical protein